MEKQKSEDQTDNMPQACELQDLFNFDFNELGSCLDLQIIKKEQYWENASQSSYLFLKKFGGKKGLLEKLQSSKNGLKRNEDEVKKRKDKYGANEFKETPIKSILHRIYDHSQDSLLRILFVGSFVSILIGISKDISRVTNQQSQADKATDYNRGYMEGLTIILTFFLITLVDAIMSQRCEKQIRDLNNVLNPKKIKVFCKDEIGCEEKWILPAELVVGDVYQIEPGQIVPADSILIQVDNIQTNKDMPFNQTQKYFLQVDNIQTNKDKTFNQTQKIQVYRKIDGDQNKQEMQILCNEQDVTGCVDYQIKGTIDESDIKEDSDKTNILYQKSYIVEGSGRAVVCAVGTRTQSGMPQDVFQEETLKEERSKFKDMLGKYSKQLGKYTNYIVVILFLILLYHQIFTQNHNKNKGIYETISQVVQLVIIVIAFVMAIIPEALSLAFSICFMSYQSQYLIKQGKIIFQNYKSLELLSQTNCVLINISNWKVQWDNEKYINTFKYLSQIKDVQFIFYSDKEESYLEEFQKLIASESLQMKDGNIFIQELINFNNEIKELRKNKNYDEKYLQEQIEQKNKLIDSLEKVQFFNNFNSGHCFVLLHELRIKNQEIKNKYKKSKDNNLIEKHTCILSQSVEDMILMREADMGILIDTNFEMIDQKSVVYVKDVSYIVDAMQYSRNMVENIRKYIQFQLIVGVNLTIFILIGAILYSTPPLSPSQILWINSLMDTISAVVLASELPMIPLKRFCQHQGSRINDFYQKQHQDENSLITILDKTQPLNPQKQRLFSRKMIFNIISSTIYQQIILSYLFYIGIYFQVNGEKKDILNKVDGPETWRQQDFYDKDYIPTDKNKAFTFVYQCFYMMQIFNISNCRFTYENEINPFKSFQLLYKGMQQLWEKSRQNRLIQNPPNRQPILTQCKSEIERDELQNEHEQNNILQLKLYSIFITLALLFQILIIEYGGSIFSFRTSHLSLFQYTLSVFIGFGIVLWNSFMKLVFQKCTKILD